MRAFLSIAGVLIFVAGRTVKWLKVKQPKYREGERGWEPKV
jgi:hypothetical protein